MPIINLVYEAPEWWGWWTPWANTLAYYRFNNNLDDSSWNGNTASMAQWTATYYTVNWDNKAITTSGNVVKSGVQQQDILTANHTLSFWINQTSINYLWDARVMWALWASGAITHIWIWINGTNGLWWCVYFWQPNKSWNYTKYTYTFSLNTWYNIILSIDNSMNCSCYVNWGQVWTAQTIVTSWTTDFYFWNNYQLWDSSYMNWYLDDIIIENKAWSSTEAGDYFAQFKWNYWIS